MEALETLPEHSLSAKSPAIPVLPLALHVHCTEWSVCHTNTRCEVFLGHICLFCFLSST
jgi:hypothetical protein